MPLKTLTDLGIAIDDFRAGGGDAYSPADVAELLDIGRANRLTFAHDIIVAFEKRLNDDVAPGWEIRILYDGSRLRFAHVRKGTMSSLDPDTALLSTML